MQTNPTNQLIEEAEKRLSNAFKIGTKQGFTPDQVLMLNEVYRDVTCIFEEYLTTIATKSAEEERNKVIIDVVHKMDYPEKNKSLFGSAYSYYIDGCIDTKKQIVKALSQKEPNAK